MFAPLPRVVLVSNGARASDQDMGEVRERHRDEHRTRQRSRVDPRGLFRSGSFLSSKLSLFQAAH